MTIGANDRLDTVPFSTQWPEVLPLAGAKAARGDVSVQGLAAALGIVQQYRDWKGRRKVLVFSDARIGRQSSSIESHIRRLKSSGATVRLFSTQNQSYADRVEWQRMARTLSLASPGVLYGREVGFVDQPGRFLLMDGGRYFTSRRDLRSAILKGVVPRSVLEPLETIHFRREELNLNDLPSAFARRQGTRANYTGPVVSGLEAAISSVGGAAQSPVGTAGGTRVLVKNGGLSFWIRGHDRGILSQMRRSLGRKIYVGLHVAPAPGSGEKLVNLPAPVYIRTQGDVPQLLITTWADLIRRPDRSLVRTDTHFLLLEILEVDDGRSSQDIRY